ncbi:MAG: Bro-N domain-containing protein [Neisseriaceae bacterium]|nr:Bro-N domain-containing protein [Neisseriaceae bacterium]
MPTPKEQQTAIKLFEDYQVRSLWDNEQEKWYFAVVDIVAVLTGTDRPRKYWNDLKNKLLKEGSQLSDKIGQLKMQAADGKNYKTDVLDTENIFRLIQSIPSPKAEPFKLWLAKVGNERLDEIADPEMAIHRALQTYLNKGYSPEWVNQRLKAIEIRKELTDEWQKRGVEHNQFGLLTDILTQAWSGLKTREYKDLKGLKKENLRDNMSNLELVFNMLAEVSTTELSKRKQPDTLQKNIQIARQGGSVARVARLNLEQQTGEKVVSSENHKQIKKIR